MENEPSIEMRNLDMKHEDETLDVSNLTNEGTISEDLPTKEMTEAESSEHKTAIYLYAYGVMLEFQILLFPLFLHSQ